MDALNVSHTDVLIYVICETLTIYLWFEIKCCGHFTVALFGSQTKYHAESARNDNTADASSVKLLTTEETIAYSRPIYCPHVRPYNAILGQPLWPLFKRPEMRSSIKIVYRNILWEGIRRVSHCKIHLMLSYTGITVERFAFGLNLKILIYEHGGFYYWIGIND